METWLQDGTMTAATRCLKRVGGGPRRITLCAQDVAVDQVADPPNRLADHGEDDAAVEHQPWVDAVPPRADGERDEAGDDGAEEGHAALPEGNQVDRIADELPEIGLLHIVVEACAEQPEDDGPDRDLLGDRARDTLADGKRKHPELIGDEEGDCVEDPIPVDGERAQLEYRIDVDRDHADHGATRGHGHHHDRSPGRDGPRAPDSPISSGAAWSRDRAVRAIGRVNRSRGGAEPREGLRHPW